MQPNTQNQKRKILLLHGWDWRKYPKFQLGNHINHQWQNRQEFLDLMKGEFDVDYPSLPGFAHQYDSREPWKLEDYVVWTRDRINSHRYDGFVGYSFGAAIVLKYIAETNSQTPAILVSPAIVRKYKPRPSKYISRMRELFRSVLGTRLTFLLRHIYMMVWVRNKFYIHGTHFLRGTYLNIVDENLSADLRAAVERDNDIHLVFGREDRITPPALLFGQVPEAKNITTIITNGDHHVATTHPQQLFEVIRASIQKPTHS